MKKKQIAQKSYFYVEIGAKMAKNGPKINEEMIFKSKLAQKCRKKGQKLKNRLSLSRNWGKNGKKWAEI